MGWFITWHTDQAIYIFNLKIWILFAVEVSGTPDSLVVVVVVVDLRWSNNTDEVYNTLFMGALCCKTLC